MNFNDRTTYLVWILEWKQTYHLLSESIRVIKQQYKQAQRENDWSTQSTLCGAHITACERAKGLLAERHESKRAAQRQYLAEHRPMVQA